MSLLNQGRVAQIDDVVLAMHAYNLASTKVQLGDLELAAITSGVGSSTWRDYINHQRKKESDILVSSFIIAPPPTPILNSSTRKVTREVGIPRGLSRGAILVVSTRKGKGGRSPGPASSQNPVQHESESQTRNMNWQQFRPSQKVRQILTQKSTTTLLGKKR